MGNFRITTSPIISVWLEVYYNSSTCIIFYSTFLCKFYRIQRGKLLCGKFQPKPTALMIKGTHRIQENAQLLFSLLWSHYLNETGHIYE